MRFALASVRRSISFALLSLVSSVGLTQAGDRVPLVGTDPPTHVRPSVVSGTSGQIVPIDTLLVPCPLLVTFSELEGGASPGTSYDGIVSSGDLQFGQHFVGQSLSYSGDFDVVSGLPEDPLQLEVGWEGQNLDVFDFAGNVLAGLGPIGYPDIDAIGEGSIAIYFPSPQSKVKLAIVGGNGGSATLSFYRTDGSLIDEVLVSGLADLAYGFGTAPESNSIAGILIQNTDASGIGLSNICYDVAAVSARRKTWGILKRLYR
jgi:hypothetical protein